MQEWNIELADAVQTTGEFSLMIVTRHSFYNPLLITDFSCDNPDTWLQQFNMDSDIDMLRQKASSYFQHSSMYGLFNLESAGY